MSLLTFKARFGYARSEVEVISRGPITTLVSSSYFKLRWSKSANHMWIWYHVAVILNVLRSWGCQTAESVVCGALLVIYPFLFAEVSHRQASILLFLHSLQYIAILWSQSGLHHLWFILSQQQVHVMNFVELKDCLSWAWEKWLSSSARKTTWQLQDL